MNKHRDFSGAVFMIFIGTIFLLNTTGTIGWGIWLYLFRFWPIFLILGGIKLILGKNFISEIVVTIISLILFTLIGLTSYVAYTGNHTNFLPKEINNCISNNCGNFWGQVPGKKINETMSVDIDSSVEYEERNFSFDIGAADFTVSDSQLDKHIQGEFEYSENYREPYFANEIKDNNLDILFATKSTKGFVFNPNSIAKYTFTMGALDQKISNIDIDLGAGDGTFTLDEMLVKNFDAKVGAGALNVELSGQSLPTGDIRLDIGAGEVILVLPENVGYTITYDLGVGEISADGESIATFAGSEDNRKSSNYEDSEIRVNIIANVGVGSLKINSK